jgi:hypothetical protein
MRSGVVVSGEPENVGGDVDLVRNAAVHVLVIVGVRVAITVSAVVLNVVVVGGLD